MHFSIHFDPKKDAAADVQASVLRMYATVSGAALADAASDDGEGEPGTEANPAQLDNTGVPHDKRIHSAKPTITKEGSWRKRKGISEAEFNQLHAELKARTQAAPSAGIVATAAPSAPPQTLGLGAPAPGLQLGAPLPTEYERLIKLIADNTHTSANPGGQLTPEWVRSTLMPHFQIASGNIQDLQNMDQGFVRGVRHAVCQALKLPQD